MRRRYLSLIVYGDLAAMWPWRAAVAIALTVAATLSEGVALLLLIPMVDFFSGNRGSMHQGVIGELLVMADLQVNIVSLIAIFAAAALLSAGLVYRASVVTSVYAADIEARLRERLFEALMRMEWKGLARYKTGLLVKALLQDTPQAATGFLALLTASGGAFSAVVYIALAAIVSWPMTLATLVFGAVTVPPYLWALRRAQASGSAVASLSGELTAEAAESIGAAKILLSLGLGEFAIGRFFGLSDTFRTQRQKLEKHTARVRLIFEAIAVVFVAVLLFALLGSQRSVGAALVFLAVFYRLAPRLSTLQSNFFAAAARGQWLLRWRRMMRLAEAAKANRPGIMAPEFQHSIEFRNVAFSYDKRELFSNINFTLRRGECIALVGGSGQGKSTIIDLITGIVVPRAGSVVIDGTELSGLDLKRWQQKIGLVLQDPLIVHSSIAENVALGAAIDPDAVMKVCKLAGADSFINRIPGGLDAILSERGANLSGGQRQRIALARALYRKPSLLILDEATSGLDPATENDIVVSLTKLKGEVTTLIVAHGGKILDMADRVLELKGGVLEEVAMPLRDAAQSGR